MTNILVCKRGGYLVPSGRYAEAAFDDLPQGIPLVASVKLTKSSRSLEQNSLMWSLLFQLATDLKWHGFHLTAEEWKDLLTAGLKGQKLVQGIDGGLVAIGGRTRDMTVKEMTDLIELILNFGAREGVVFREVEHA